MVQLIGKIILVLGFLIILTAVAAEVKARLQIPYGGRAYAAESIWGAALL